MRLQTRRGWMSGSWWPAVALVGAWAVAAASAARGEELRVRFGAEPYDRWLFQPKPGQTHGRWDGEADGLRATIPKGPLGRPPSRFVLNARLKGDFQVSVVYEARRLPLPRRQAGIEDYNQSNNIGLGLRVAGSSVSVYHNARPTGEGVGFFAQLADGGTAWNHKDFKGAKGSLRIRREGTRITLLHGADGGELGELGSFEAGDGPADELDLSIMPLNTLDGVEVVFNNLTIRADRIERTLQPAEPWGAAAWIGIGLVVVALAAWPVWRWGRARREPAIGRGFTLIEVLVVIAVIGILVGLLIPAVQMAREAARRGHCLNNLRQIGLALHSYESTHAVYPFGVGGGAPPGSVPRWSAHSQLLPFLEQTAVFNALNFSAKPWVHELPDGPINSTALGVTIAGFLCPSDTASLVDPMTIGQNSYRGCAGTLPYNLLEDSPDRTGRNNGVFWQQSAVRPSHIQDGLGNTAMFSEHCLFTPARPDLLSDYFLTADAVASCKALEPFSAPRLDEPYMRSGGRWGDGNVVYTRYHHINPPLGPSCLLGGSEDYDSQVVSTASSRHPGGVNLLLGDGSARFEKATVAPAPWRALGTIAGGEAPSAGAD